LYPFHGYVGSFAKPHKTRVYDGGGARGLPCARGPYIPHARGSIRGVLYGILWVGIRHTIELVPSLIAVVLQPRAAQSTFMTLCEAYPRVDPGLDMWNYFFRV
jgi:hypothetical protein